MILAEDREGLGLLRAEPAGGGQLRGVVVPEGEGLRVVGDRRRGRCVARLRSSCSRCSRVPAGLRPLALRIRDWPASAHWSALRSFGNPTEIRAEASWGFRLFCRFSFDPTRGRPAAFHGSSVAYRGRETMPTGGPACVALLASCGHDRPRRAFAGCRRRRCRLPRAAGDGQRGPIAPRPRGRRPGRCKRRGSGSESAWLANRPTCSEPVPLGAGRADEAVASG